MVCQEASDVEEAFERYKEEMTDVAESIELATLDREMAEEKVDSFHIQSETLTSQSFTNIFIYICLLDIQ